MNWMKRMRPRLGAFLKPKTTDDTLWCKCPGCGEINYNKDLERQQHVCAHCGHHYRLAAKARLGITFDDGQWTNIDFPDVVADPLRFKDKKPYKTRLREARSKTGAKDAVALGYGRIHNQACVVAVQDFHFLGGSLGMAAGEAFIRGANEAVERNCPYLVFTAAGGARMQEGILSLMQMPRTTVAIQQLRAAHLPYIVILTDPTTGGVTASYGMLGDIHIAEPNALIGFAGPRVIEQTIKETLPDDFQRAEYLLHHGMVDMVVARPDLPAMLARTMGLLMHSHSQGAQQQRFAAQ